MVRYAFACAVFWVRLSNSPTPCPFGKESFMENNYIPFTKEMKKEYVILAPNMLPMHFELILQILSN